MSAFLGPIHFWLYNKIQFQESLIDELVRVATAQGWSDEDLADKAWEEEMGKSWKSPPLDSVDKNGISLIRRTAMPPQNTDDWEMRDEDYDQPFM